MFAQVGKTLYDFAAKGLRGYAGVPLLRPAFSEVEQAGDDFDIGVYTGF